MNRRKTLGLLAAGIAVAGAGGYHWLTKPRDHAALALDTALDRLDTLQLGQIETTGAWKVGRTFNHLAQSIEFSMAGFPEPKPPLFQNTVGKLAFNVFQARGAMSHGLDEVIPGEVVIESDAAAGLARLKTALNDFSTFTAPLQPHFAYGALDHAQYARAHVMHINNHLEEFRLG